MTYDEVSRMWAEDGTLDQTDVSREVLRVPELHNKYYTLFVEESLRLKKLRAQRAVLINDKTDLYTGQMDIEDIKERGWKPLPKMILKNEVQRHLDADSDVIEINMKMAARESTCKFLESIVGMITYRQQSLKLLHDIERFRSGA